MIALALLLTCLVGWLVLRSWLRTGPAVAICLSFAAGAAAVSLQLLLYDLARIPWSRLAVIGPWLALALLSICRQRPRLGRPSWRRPHWLEWLAMAFGAAVLLAWAPYERLMPLNEWDAVMLWMFKGKAFYVDGSVAPYLRRAPEFLGNAAYPLLVPLYSTFVYIWMGEAADHAAKILSPCFFASLVAGLYYFVRRFGSPPVAAIFAAMLMGVYMVDFTAFHYAGYADTAVAAAVLLASGFVLAWFREDQFTDFALAVLFASAAAWTKNEGLLFLAGFGAIAGLGLLWKRVWNWRFWAALAGFPFLAVIPWSFARSHFGIGRPGQLSKEIVETNISSYWPTLKALLEHAFAPSVFNLVFPLWLLAVILHRRAGLDRKFLLLPLLVVWQLFGATMVYVTGPVNLQWMIGSSLDRVLSQIVPLALLCAALVVASYYNAAESRLTEAAINKKRPNKAAPSRGSATAAKRGRR